MYPLVTIILTVYRRTDYIREALESALAQTYSATEIVVADDSDSAAIAQICSNYPDKRVLYRPNPVNLGVTKSVGNAISRANGEYVAILNDDDVWEPEFLASLVSRLESDPGSVLAFCNHWIIDGAGRIDSGHSERQTEQYGRAALSAGRVGDLAGLVLLRNGVPLAMASVFRRSAIDPGVLVDEVRGAYDFWISCQLAASGRSAHFEPGYLTRYRVHDAMETARAAPDKNLNMVFIFSRLREMPAFRRFATHLHGKLAEAQAQVGIDLLAHGMAAQARGRFIEALGIRVQPKSLAGLLATFFPPARRAFLARVNGPAR
jgi:glycosyltransferase involved in cell wall biosynthesis